MKERTERIEYLIDCRSLTGMLKVAWVRRVSPVPWAWKLFSDEGKYLNGTDLAPPPLSFFSAGLQFSFLDQLQALAGPNRAWLGELTSVLETHYRMRGSFLRGDMEASAEPVELTLSALPPVARETMADWANRALARSEAHALMRDSVWSTFALEFNGRTVALQEAGGGELPLRLTTLGGAPAPALSAADLPAQGGYIARTEEPEVAPVAEGGVSVGLQPLQDRRVRLRNNGHYTQQGEGMEWTVKVVAPIGGSVFQIQGGIGTDNSESGAPSALAYLSAGIAFCYMTQLSRYAQIAKVPVETLRLLQRTTFTREELAVTAGPVETKVFVTGALEEDAARRLLIVGQRTCFLHAALRGMFPTRVSTGSKEPIKLRV